MKRIYLLYIAAFLCFITFAGHTVGAILMPNPQTPEVIAAEQVMAQTPVPMPFGNPQSFTKLQMGGDIFVCIYLFISGSLFLLLARDSDRKLRYVLVNSLGLMAAAVTSFVFYFPLPGIILSVAALLGLIYSRSELRLLNKL